MQIRRFALSSVATGAALGVVALSAGAASAHVTVTPSTTAAGSYAVLTFSLGHGCEGSPTTKLTFQVPQETPSVTPTVNPNWEVEKVMETLAEPLTDSHGNQVTERVGQVVYTARTPLADGYRDTVALQVQLPSEEDVELVFPVIQTCVEGETDWVETAAEGQSADDLDSPAPLLVTTAAESDGHGADTEAEQAEEDAESTEASADDSDSGKDSAEDSGSNQGLAIAGLVAGVGGLVLGGAAFARAGKKA